MSLQDKISSAKPTTFLTNGLSEEEVKQAVDDGRKRSMTDTVKLIIEMPKEIMGYVKTNDCLSVIYIDEVAKAIQNGIPLDSAEIEKKCDRINSISSVLRYPQHREIQELLCGILESIGGESEE